MSWAMGRTAVLFSLLLGCGCRGTLPERFGEARLGFGAVLIRGRFILPTGEDRRGWVTLNLESETGERYRLRFQAGETSLLMVEPDFYRLHPARNPFGFVKNTLTVRLGRDAWRVPFPRDILRKAPLDVKPTRLVPIGVLEVRFLPIKKGEMGKIVIHLDDSVAARRGLVEEMVTKMMDSKAPIETRRSAISWVRALEQALVLIQGEHPTTPGYKPSGP
ncbi:MAG: hypothetical protein WC728_11240 [Elusimicrobiota bacterium]